MCDIIIIGWGIQSEPGKRICPVNISAITQPTDHMSTVGEEEAYIDMF